MSVKTSDKILCVDDDPNVLEGLHRQLRHDFEVSYAAGSDAALELMEKAGPFAVVVSDYMMPGMSGADLLCAVRERSPDTVTVLLTGCNEIEVAIAALHRGRIFRVLNKPCERDVLHATLRDALEQHRLVVNERALGDALRDANAQLQRLNTDLQDRVNERTATIARLFDFVSELNGKDNVQDVADLIVQTTAELLRSQRVSLMLPDAGGEYLTIAAAVGIPPEICARARQPIGAAVAGEVFSEGRAVVVDSAASGAPHPARYDAASFAALPLVTASVVDNGHVIGVLNVTEPWSGANYDSESLATFQAIAESGSVALLNQIRVKERDEARDAVILALAKLAEHRDPETGAHLERVQRYCQLLAESLAHLPKCAEIITPTFIQTIYRSAPLHDIGKVGIPDRILLKPGRLDEAEFEIMKRHTTIGGDTIRGLLAQRQRQGFLHMGMDIAYSHHEKYDGSGYPRGLKGEDIPLAARIMALADVYDALRSRRVYKPAMSHADALHIISDGAGKHFDPDIVAAFLGHSDDFERLAEQLADAPADEVRQLAAAGVA